MSNFNVAFNNLLKKEGGYSNNPNDKGGETFVGICRKFYPKLKIWETIDTINNNYPDKKKAKSIINGLRNKSEYMDEIKKVYKTNYWDKIYLDNLYSQRIAEMLFDDAVNRGVIAAIKTAQNILNLPRTGNVDKQFIEKISNYGVRKKFKDKQ